MTRTPLAVAAILAAALTLGGCAGGGSLFGSNTERAKGPGTGTDALRISPCACMELPNLPPDGTALRELRRTFGG